MVAQSAASRGLGARPAVGEVQPAAGRRLISFKRLSDSVACAVDHWADGRSLGSPVSHFRQAAFTTSQRAEVDYVAAHCSTVGKSITSFTVLSRRITTERCRAVASEYMCTSRLPLLNRGEM